MCSGQQSIANEPKLPAVMDSSENEKGELTLLVSSFSQCLDLQREAQCGD